MRKKFAALTVLGLIASLISSCSNGRPDLTVKSIECREGKLFFSLANEGDSSLPEDWVALASLYIDGIVQEDVVLNEPTATHGGGVLEPGGTSDYWTAFDVDRILRVDIYVDYTKEITESNEENNSAENVYIEPCDLPDLTVESLSLDEDCYVVVKIKNQGEGSLPIPVWDVDNKENCGVTLLMNGQEWGKKTLWEIDPTRSLDEPDGSITFTSGLKVNGPAEISAKIDAIGAVYESDEGNNRREEILNCKK